ncbi:hypothetical protein [Oleiharenicola sp. Vm1]|uniref:hypothetical protein n=1 Tax=Oleiharenicola sp. Vm1 TaxID=3398393 RepID=UPI0039F4B5E5
MKTQFAALALALATLFALATPKTAQANDTGAVLGGFLGGVIVGSVLADQHHGPDAVIVQTGYHRGPDRCDEPAGYWRQIHTRVWVPGFWTMERDHWGRPYRRYVEGHYEIRTERVWVAYNDYGRYDRRDRRW